MTAPEPTFEDRHDAGQRLLDRLGPLDPDRTVVLALPRGGVPVADVIANGIGAPLDLVLVRKVGVPGHAEFALAAVTEGADPVITVSPRVARMTGFDDAAIAALARRELPELRRRREVWLKGRPPLPLAGKTIVVVDDGIATGATMRAALGQVADAAPAHVIAAIPVAPAEAIAEIAPACDTVICLETPRDFRAVGLHYRDFGQVADETVADILDRHARRMAPSGPVDRAGR